jgi:benzodiazapine receptor
MTRILSEWLPLAVAVLFCQSAGILGALATASSRDTWYRALNKPPFNPPDWVFGPVWLCLYLMMAIAAYLVWRSTGAAGPRRLALALFAVQLLLNALWTPAFFGLRSPALALVVILALAAAIVATIVAFRPISPAAALLLVPYLAWVLYATVLNVSIVVLN